MKSTGNSPGLLPGQQHQRCGYGALGIAIIGLTTARAGSSQRRWDLPLGTVTTNSFVPDSENGAGAITTTYRAWDRTSGVQGTKVSTATTGAATAFSTATDSAGITVTSVNDAPVLAAASPTLTSIDEDATGNSGNLVSAIVGSSISDVDTGALQGIAIIGLTSGTGTWEYSINGGGTWTAIGTVNDSSSLLLRSQDLVRLVPDGLNGTSASLTYRAWDRTSGTEGTMVSTASRGAATAFSIATDSAGITVTSVNDAPTAANNTCSSTDEDTDRVFAAGEFKFQRCRHR